MCTTEESVWALSVGIVGGSGDVVCVWWICVWLSQKITMNGTEQIPNCFGSMFSGDMPAAYCSPSSNSTNGFWCFPLRRAGPHPGQPRVRAEKTAIHHFLSKGEGLSHRWPGATMIWPSLSLWPSCLDIVHLNKAPLWVKFSAGPWSTAADGSLLTSKPG